MKRAIPIGIVLVLSVMAASSVDAQQRSTSSRRAQANRTSSAATVNQNTSSDATTNDVDAARVPSGVPAPPVAPGDPNPPGVPAAPGFPRPPRIGGFALIGLQNSAREAASTDDGKVKTTEFLAEFMKAAKKADSDNDGRLSAEELETLMPRRPEGENGGRPGQGRGRRTNESAAQATDSVTIRAQAPNAEPRGRDNRENGNRPQGRGPGAPQGGFFGGSQETPFLKAITDSFEEDGSVNLAKLEKLLKEALDKADSDNDGSLADDEWRAFAGGFGGRGMGGPGFGGFGQNQNPNAFRAMQILAVQRDAQTVALGEDGKLDIAKFRAEYVRLLKEADANKDGFLKEDELQAMQQKAMERMQEEMRSRFPNGVGWGFGGPRQGGGPGGFMNEFKNDKGEIELAKLADSQLPDQIKGELKAADANGDGLLDEDEQTSFQNQMRERFQNGGGPGFGGPRNGGDGRGQRGSRRNDSSQYTPVAPVNVSNLEVIVRGQEAGVNNGSQGFQRRGSERRGGPGFGGGFPGGMGMGGFGGFGRGGANAVMTAATKAMSEDGSFKISDFDAELGRLLTDADNEDDGILEIDEQTDAFGYPLAPQNMFGEQGGRPQGGPGAMSQGGRNAQGGNRGGQPNGRGFQGRGEDVPESIIRARFLPTPDPNLFVGVSANDSFKFAKPFAKDGTAEKVAIESDYAIGKYEVRNREYKEFVEATKRTKLPSSWVDGTYSKGTKNCPVVGVTLKDAEDYCEWLGTKYEGWTFRLPTEAEFENAASGPQKQLFPWGKTSGFAYSKGELTANCQYNAAVVASLIADDGSATINGKTTKVADLVAITNKGVLSKGWRDSKTKTGFTYSSEFEANSKVGGYLVPVYKFQDNRSPYGCVGMSGNAAEWTSTVIDGKNVVRGGSWYSSAEECSATYRGESRDPSKSAPTVGFRVVAERI